MRVRLAELRERYADPEVRVVNALWPEMYTGADNPFGNKRAGHIPGSVSLPIERLFAGEAVPRLKPAPELRAALDDVGLTAERETIVHCQAGVRTTMVLAGRRTPGVGSRPGVRGVDGGVGQPRRHAVGGGRRMSQSQAGLPAGGRNSRPGNGPAARRSGRGRQSMAKSVTQMVSEAQADVPGIDAQRHGGD